jgi:hypothetical protein
LQWYAARTNLGICPVIYRRDGRYKKCFSYKDYVHLTELVDALMDYIERVGAHAIRKKDKKDIKDELNKFVNGI